ncbi:MAG: helix-turn-helix domain-containing protein [Thermodesulfobacteriota bacterium]
MTTEEVAELLRVSISTIRKWVHYGFVPHVKIGRLVRYRRSDITQWIDERATEGRTGLVPDIGF